MITYWMIGYLDLHSDMLASRYIRYLTRNQLAYREYQAGLIAGVEDEG